MGSNLWSFHFHSQVQCLAQKLDFLGFFIQNSLPQKGVAFKKMPLCPLPLYLALRTDQSFQMRYITCLNSQWFWNDKPSNLKIRKKSILVRKFELSSLTAYGTTKARKT